MKYLPNGDFPENFALFVDMKAQTDVKPKFLKEHTYFKDLDYSTLRLRHFGFLVWSDFCKLRSSVRNDLNVFWKEANLRRGITASGINNTSGVLRAIRRKFYFNKVSEGLWKSITNKKNYAATNNKPPPFENELAEQSYHAENMQKKKDMFIEILFPV